MRFILSTAALAALCTVSLAETKCHYRTQQFAADFDITASGVPDIPGTCGGLWDNLKRFADCIGVGNNEFCREEENGDLRWHFQNGASCNAGMVESAWYEATKNEYGPLDCGV
ncbi:hypothetical protein IQ06DRAFT_342457 [Phaeosphaeriaceae sp. SRC1lsM3a]|nr:hypothetical protein IQ06DRAFT_342457 [Stagonospora sp. SRC1lsM3a]